MAAHVRPLYIPPLSRDGPDAGRLILRDGTTATIRLAQPSDRPALQTFVDRLSAESKRHRFFSESSPPPEVIASLCNTSDPRALVTLLVTRTWEGEPRIIAAGSYLAKDEHTAEVAMAVDDAFHGKGLGTLLLERLALLAVRHGFDRLWAATHAENLAMREVFRESGCEVRERLEGAEMDVDLSLLPTEASVARSDLRERIATAASLRPFFRPKSVAVIGASRDPASIGYRLLECLMGAGFRGSIYPVNPSAVSLGGLRVFPSARDLPRPVDLAIIAVPRDAVLQVVDDCAAAGVRALVIITAGFAEVNDEGRALQARLLERARQSGMRLVGPNCMGLVNTDPDVRLNATFAPVYPPAGRVAMSSQSGALGLAILAVAHRLHLGVSTFVSVGNKADVSGNDLLQYWEEDDRTDLILLYLESFGNPRRFARIARRVSRRKPIVAVKAGRTQAGQRAAGSHTAALASPDVAVDALFHQTGVIRAETLDEMFALASALAGQPLPPGRRVAILTNAGGPAILCADACEAGGLIIPPLAKPTQATLATFLPAAASLGNPIDLIASATGEHYRRAIETVLGSDEIDALIVIHVSVWVAKVTAVAEAIREGVKNVRTRGFKEKPVLVCWMTGDDDADLFAQGDETIPSYGMPETPARVLSKTSTYAEWVEQPPGMIPDFEDLDLARATAICRQALSDRGGGWLSAQETRAVLTAARLPLPRGGLAATADEAATMARDLGFPVAVKLASHRIVHKTEIGGVRLNLTDEAAVRQAFEKIHERLKSDGKLDAMDGVLVQPMLSGGVEVMVGVTQDPLFGPLIAFGLGGIHVEILHDLCFRVTPLTDRDAHEMVRGIKGYRLLEGYRGAPPADIAAIEEVLLRISRLVEEVSEITEVDLNPIMALAPGQGCWIVDARIKVGCS